jgi:RNA polymerase sigma factor (sigma-70 family)
VLFLKNLFFLKNLCRARLDLVSWIQRDYDGDVWKGWMKMSKAIHDIDLLKNCLKGHTKSFEVLVGRYQSLVCAITYGATGNVDRSEELAQETFLLAWKNLRQLKDLAKFKGWLCRIARSVIQNWLRKRQRDVVDHAAPLEAAAAQPDSLPAPQEQAIQAEQQAVVNQALEAIPQGYRLPLILFYREEKSTREVAALIGLNENATRQRIARARAMLKEQVAAMVETTLAQSKPSKAFTAGVVASLAGISMKATAAAVGVATTGVSALVTKLSALAAGLLIVAGISYTVYKRQTPNPAPVSQQIAPAVTSANDIDPANVPVVEPVATDARTIGSPSQTVTEPETVQAEQPAALPATPFEFEPTGVLSGLITDAQTGRPVQNVRIRVGNNGIGDVRTDEHGFYHVDRIFRPGNCTVYVDSNDYVGFGMNSNAPKLNLSQEQQVVKHFKLGRACKAAVQVVDVNGVGIAGVDVIPTSLTDSRRTRINDQGLPRHTDHMGHILLGGFPPSSSEYMITALAQKAVRKRQMGEGLILAESELTHCPAHALVRLTDPNVTTRVKIVLELGQTIHGYAEYSDQTPALEIQIGAQPSWWHCNGGSSRFASVNSDGTFAVPHIVPGTYNIQMATVNDDGLPISSRVILQTKLPLADNEALFLRLPIPAPQAGVSISGQFVFSGEKKPHSVMVHARSRTHGSKSFDLQIMSGRNMHAPFSLDGLKAGSYRLRFTGTDIEELVLDDIVAPSNDLEVQLAAVGKPQIEGFVLDQLTGNPIHQFQIRTRKIKTLRGENYAPTRDWIAFTQDTGYFQVESAGPGIYQVQALADGYAPSWSEAINTDENQVLEVSLTPGGSLSGIIMNQAGELINHGKVIPLSYACDTNTRTQHLFASEKGAVVSQDGVFKLDHLPVGPESLKLIHPDYAPQTIAALEVRANQITAVADIILSSGGSVEGLVLDEHDRPLPNQTLCFCDAETGTTDDASQRWATVVTDVNGFYRVQHLPTRLCYVYRDTRWQMQGVMRRSVTAQEGQITRLDFGGSFQVKGVFDQENEEFRQRRISLRAAIPAHFDCLTMTDDAGQFCFSGIVPGTYQLVYYDSEKTPRWQTISSVTVANDDLDLGSLDAATLLAEVNHPWTPPPVSTEPLMRRIALKLPLLQPRFHWTFMNRADYLAGKLILRIKQGDKSTAITVFEQGRISEGWRPAEFPPNPKAGEVYFGFSSTQKYLSAPDDQLEIELHVVKDLHGIGAIQTGILPMGVHRAQGSYSMITDEFQVPEAFKAVSNDVIEKMRENVEYRVHCETWQTKWSLRITAEKGWLDEQQREQFQRMIETLDKQEQ